MADAPLFEDEPTGFQLQSELAELKSQVTETMAEMIIEKARLKKNILLLLKNVGNPAFCGRQGNGCGREIYWVTHANGKKTPYDPDGQNHWATCPNAAAFRKKK